MLGRRVCWGPVQTADGAELAQTAEASNHAQREAQAAEAAVDGKSQSRHSTSDVDAAGNDADGSDGGLVTINGRKVAMPAWMKQSKNK